MSGESKAVSDTENLLFQVKQLNNRFERMEKHVDEVRNAIVQMARTEERVSVILDQNTTLFKKIDAVNRRIDEATDASNVKIQKLQTENATQSQSLGFFERLGWIVVSVIGGIIGWMFRG